MNQAVSLVPVKYIGVRPSYTDGTFGTKINFDRGDSRMVPVNIAKLMLKHPDVYTQGDADALTVEIAPARKDEDEAQNMRDAVANMGKDALASFAKTHFNASLDKRKGVNDLRQQVTVMVDQFGVV